MDDSRHRYVFSFFKTFFNDATTTVILDIKRFYLPKNWITTQLVTLRLEVQAAILNL